MNMVTMIILILYVKANWIYLTNNHFMKYVNFTLQKMTPEQLKMNPFKPIIKDNPNQELDTEEGESTETKEDSKSIGTSQVHMVLNKSTQDKAYSSEDEHVTEIEPYTVNGEQNNGKENKFLTTNFEVKMEN